LKVHWKNIENPFRKNIENGKNIENTLEIQFPNLGNPTPWKLKSSN